MCSLCLVEFDSTWDLNTDNWSSVCSPTGNEVRLTRCHGGQEEEWENVRSKDGTNMTSLFS